MLDRQLVRELLLDLTRATPALLLRRSRVLHTWNTCYVRPAPNWSGAGYAGSIPTDTACLIARRFSWSPVIRVRISLRGLPGRRLHRRAATRLCRQAGTRPAADRGHGRLRLHLIRFGHADDWGQIAARYPHIFGVAQTMQAASPREPGKATGTELDLELFDEKWHALLHELAQELSSGMIEPGGDVALGGRVVGRYFAQVTLRRSRPWLVDAAEPYIERIKEAITGAGHGPVVVAHEQWPEAVQDILQMSREQ